MSITLTATQSVTTLNLTATQSGTSVNLSPVINSIGGTVTSVAINGNDGIQIDSGSPITTSGTIELGLDSDASQYPFVIDDDTMATASDTTVPTSESVKAYVDSIGGGTSLELDVTQATHGFSVGDAIRHNGTIYVKAQADSASNAGVIGVVSDVADTDNFTIQYGGILAAGVWTNGTPYFLSPSVAGSIVTEPTYNVGEVRQYIGTGTPDGLLVEIDLGDEVTTAVTGDMLASVYDPANKSEQLLGISDLIDDDTFATATATNIPSAESVKAYVDANSGFYNYNQKIATDTANNTSWHANDVNQFNYNHTVNTGTATLASIAASYYQGNIQWFSNIENQTIVKFTIHGNIRSSLVTAIALVEYTLDVTTGNLSNFKEVLNTTVSWSDYQGEVDLTSSLTSTSLIAGRNLTIFFKANLGIFSSLIFNLKTIPA